ncbi:DUF6153 family protein [Streptomyces sp. NPDC054841]
MAARLLLVVVLALGVFVMHTVGHPSGDSGTGTLASSHTAGTGAMPVHGHHADAVTDTGPPAAMGATDLNAAPAGAGAPASPDGHEPGMAMDMVSLCVAVLGTWALALLLHVVFVGRRDWCARLAAGVLAVVRANPPPRAPDLAQLSILRL